MSSSSKTHKNLKIVYGGNSHEIDAEVLIESLVSYSVVIQEASAYLSPESRVSIKIQAQREGSFELLLDIVANEGGTIFNKENLDFAATLVTIVGSLYGLKKFLSKDSDIPGEDIQEISVENSDNSVIVKTNNGQIEVSKNVYHIYQTSEKAREGLRNTFLKLKNAEEIESFEIIDQDTQQEIFRANKEDFKIMASDKNEAKQKKQTEKKSDQELSVFKIVFKEKYKWEFFYNGVRIYAAILDEEFSSKVSKGEIAFRSGDRMIADIEIIQVFNEAANTFVNDEYFITKVKKHIPRVSFVQESIKFEKTEKGEET